MKRLIILLAVIITALILPPASLAKIGVGVGTGKIEINEALKPGKNYNLPPLTVVNTGDEPGEYTVSVDYRGDQQQLRPDKEWFKFEPPQFFLEPGKTQTVQVGLTLPVKTRPGDYFAYFQSQPVKKTNATGGATIGVAAATKLYFTVAPSNIFQGVYYRTISLLNMYSPWSWVVLALIAGAVIIVALKSLFKKFFKFQFKISRK